MSPKLKKTLSRALSIGLSLTTTLWLSGLALLAPLSVQAVEIKDGDLIRATGDIDVYIVKIVGDKSFKRLILNPDIFNQYGHLKWENVKEVSQSVVDSYTTSTLVRLYDPAYGLDDPKVYKLFPDGDVGTKKHLDMTPSCFVDQGYDWDSIYIINKNESDSYTTGEAITCPTVTPTGGLSIEASDMVATTVVPLYATGVDFLKFKVTANEDATIDSVTLTRKGVGAYSDIEYLYLYDGDTRLTNGKSISSDSDTVTFSNIGLALSAGETKELTVKADMDASGTGAGNVDYIELTSLSADSVDVSGLPIAGTQYSIASSSAATLTIGTGGTPTNPTIGDTGAILAKFRIYNVANEKVKFQRITLTNSGSVDLDNIDNWKLYRGSELLAEGTVSGDAVTFVLDTPYLIDKGASRYFDVKGDITAANKSSETIRLYLEETTDLYCVGQSYGYGAKTTNSFTSSTGSTSLTLQGGDLTVAFNGPAATTVASSGEDVDVFEFSLTAQQNVTVKNLYLNIYDGDGSDLGTEYDNNYLTDIKVVDTDSGSTVLGPVDISSFTDNTSYVSYTFTTDFDLDAGVTRNFKVSLDISSSLTSGSWYVKLGSVSGGYIFSSTDIKSRDTAGEYITSIVPASPIQGNTMTVGSASLAVALASTPVSTTYVKGIEGIDAVGFLLTAGTAADVKVTSFQITASVDADVDGTFAAGSESSVYANQVFSAVYLYDGSTQLGTSEALTSAGVATFDNFSLTIPAGTTKKLVVKADISTTAPYGGTNDAVKIDIADVSNDIGAEDPNGTTVSSTSSDYPNGGSATAATVAITVASSGSLYAVAADDTPLTDIVLSGSSDVVFSKFKFSAVNEAFKVKKITLDNASSLYDDNITAVKITYPTDASGTTTETKTGYLSSGSVTFSGMNFYVPKDGSAYLTVKADLDTIGSSGGADSGDQPALNLSKDTTNDDEFEALGISSNTTIDDDDPYFSGSQSTQSISGNAMIVRKAKPTLANSSTQDSTLMSTTDLLQFTISASSEESESVTFKKLKFDIVVSDANTSSALTVGGSGGWALYNLTDDPGRTNDLAADSAAFGDGSGNSDPSLTNGTHTLLVELDDEEAIAPGETKEFVLVATVSNISGTSTEVDKVSTRLASESDSNVRTGAITSNTNALVQVASTTTSYVWSDKSAGVVNHDDTLGSSSSDWTNGYKVKTLPGDYVQITS